MDSEIKIKIVGPTTKDVWGRKVDLTQIPPDAVVEFAGYEYAYHKFLSIKEFKENPKSVESLNNVGVRFNNMKDEDACRALHGSYTKDGVNLNQPCPPITEDGELLDGRGRTYTHLDHDQKHMAVAVYRPTVDINEEVRVKKNAGLLSNIHPNPSRPCKIDDYISCGKSLQASGHLGNTDAELDEWLVEAGFFDAFPAAKNSSNGLAKRVKNGINNNIVSNIKEMTFPQCIEWCNNSKRNGFPDVDDENVILLNTKSLDYYLRFYKKWQVKYPVVKKSKIILWTSQKNYNSAKKDMRDAEKILRNEWIERNRMLGLSTKRGELRPIPWEIIGCIPQFEDEGHVLESRTLINPTDY